MRQMRLRPKIEANFRTFHTREKQNVRVNFTSLTWEWDPTFDTVLADTAAWAGT